MKQVKNRPLALIVMIVLPLSALGFLFYSLETYYKTVHSEAGMLVGAYALICIAANIVLWLKNRRKGKRFTVIAAISLVLLLGVLLVAEKIPFCVECDQVTKDELGFLAHWIQPMET